MMELLTIIIIQLSLVIVGFLLALTFGIKKKLEVWGLSYLLGSGLISILFFVTHWLLGWKLNQVNFIVCILVSVLSLFAVVSFKKQTKLFEQLLHFNIAGFWNKLEQIEKMLFGAVCVFFCYSLFINYFTPMTDWDALAFYDFRAKIMVLRGNMVEGANLTYFFQYPPYTTFLHVFGYLFNAQHVKIAYSLIYGSFLMTFFSLLRSRQDRSVALIAVFLLASFPSVLEHAITAYSNLAFTVFYALGIIYLWYNVRFQDRKDLLVGATLVGLSTWVRSTEPFWLVAAFLIIWAFLKNRRYLFSSLLSLAWLSLPNTLWRKFINDLNLTASVTIIDTETHTTSAIRTFFELQTGFNGWLVHFWQTSAYLVKVLLPEFLFLSLLWFLASKAFMKKWNLELVTLFLLSSIVWGGTFIFSFTFETWNKIDGSIVRMCMAFIPLLIYSTVENLSYEKK